MRKYFYRIQWEARKCKVSLLPSIMDNIREKYQLVFFRRLEFYKYLKWVQKSYWKRCYLELFNKLRKSFFRLLHLRKAWNWQNNSKIWNKRLLWYLVKNLFKEGWLLKSSKMQKKSRKIGRHSRSSSILPSKSKLFMNIVLKFLRLLKPQENQRKLRNKFLKSLRKLSLCSVKIRYMIYDWIDESKMNVYRTFSFQNLSLTFNLLSCPPRNVYLNHSVIVSVN